MSTSVVGQWDPKAIAVGSLAFISVILTFALSCAVPLAGFAVVASLLVPGAYAFGAIAMVWLLNQIVGFVWMHYPIDAATLAWGLALGVIAIGCVDVSRAVLSRASGATGLAMAMLASFIVYEGAIYAICLSSGTDMSHFTRAVIARVFLINASIVIVFLAVRMLALRTQLGRRMNAAIAREA